MLAKEPLASLLRTAEIIGFVLNKGPLTGSTKDCTVKHTWAKAMRAMYADDPRMMGVKVIKAECDQGEAKSEKIKDRRDKTNQN
jgi:hypothetical protein